jgi:alpha-galactosidase
LGDWVVYESKLAGGLEKLVEKIRSKGLTFGLWFEPEMVSEESELFKAHPDWHIHVPGYPTSLGRNQLILDFSRQEVRDGIYNQMVKILDSVPIDYIKWDMNRNMTEVGSLGRSPEAQMETSHRYMLGLYDLLERLTSRYPNILFENCSGGGGRFDPGMCYYMAQSWTSDNTDAIERLKIQYGNSMIFPPLLMCAQLSEVPNHQTGRVTDIETRAAVAMSANFGIMINPSKETSEDLEKVKGYIDWYKKNRSLIQFGDFYRLQNPYESNYGSWIFVDKKKENAMLVFVQILSKANNPLVRTKLAGLDAESVYLVNDEEMTGDELMKFGLYMNLHMSGDFQARMVEIKKINTNP